MLEVLQFLFQDFWHWLGGFFYIGAVAAGITGLVRISINRKA